MPRDFSQYAKSTYDYEPGCGKALRITKSSLTSDFDYCAKSYKYKRIDRLPEHQTDAMVKGTNIHDAIEQFYINVATSVRKAHTLLESGDRNGALEVFLSALPETENPYELGEKKVIKARLEMDLDRLLQTGPKNFLPIINEAELHAFVDETIEFNGETITIPVHYAGMIDRGFRTEDGSVALMELKTGKWVQSRKYNKGWEDSPYKLKSMRTEMMFYKHLLELTDHEYKDVTHWGWVYPGGKFLEVPPENKYGYEQRSINTIHYEPCTGRRNTDYKKRLRRMVDALITAYLTGDFPTNPSPGRCAHCSFQSICPSWEGSDDPEEYRRKWEEEE